MLTVVGPRHRYCDGLSRRSFLKVGALGVGGLTLPGLMRAEAAAGKRSHKSVIMVYLTGGLAHQDFDVARRGLVRDKRTAVHARAGHEQESQQKATRPCQARD